MKKSIAGTDIDVNEEGYLTDMSQWNEAIAAAIAAEEGIGALTDGHMKVVRYLRAAGQGRGADHPQHGQERRCDDEGALRSLPRRPAEEVFQNRRHSEARRLHLMNVKPET
jgi:tRNA 2-thiouridine synthesizing protein E